MSGLSDIPFSVYAALLAIAHLLNARVYSCEEVRKSLYHVRQGFRDCRKSLKTFLTVILRWGHRLCSRRSLSGREERRREKVEAQMQIKRRRLCDDIAKSVRRTLSIGLSVFCAFYLLSQFLPEASVTIP
eukprot:TRINITY_DN13243_c0_g3_i1.p1 TRINITY_DN13243_c0_g3~~TRINITY_DN13243_c0_g3_i1.p1  ORF type:complete len:130 (-),score=5.52 TRINITY_DN13243_c0_g3_i1:58-447(-)